MKQSMRKSKHRVVLTLLLCVVLCLAIAGIAATNIESAFAAKAGYNGNLFYSDYDSVKDVVDDGIKLVEEIAGEGYVLLKNENNALPVASGAKISVFGKNSVNGLMTGTGSSGGTQGSNPVQIIGGLEEVGFEVNPKLVDFYKDNKASGAARSVGGMSNTPGSYWATGETPQSMYTDDVKDSYEDYNDAAIVVFSRTGGEGADLPVASFHSTASGESATNATTNAFPMRELMKAEMDKTSDWKPLAGKGRESNPFEHYLELDDHEEALLEMLQASDKFDKVIVVLNSVTTMEAGFLNDSSLNKIKAAIWAPGAGINGFRSLAKIISGDINPSGRTTDAFAADFKKAPTWNNFGNNLVGNSTATTAQSGAQYTKEDGSMFSHKWMKANTGFFTTEYQEGIYLGYRYYETRAFTEDAKTGATANAWYSENVVYPFGYGLSYTNFTWSNMTIAKSDSGFTKDTEFTVTVDVKNTGSKAGKDVVQLYYSAPYTTDGIEKSHVDLGAFAKTKLLAPQETETVTLKLSAFDMASFDVYGKNANGKKVWELDKGDYKFYLGTNSHTAWYGNTTLVKTETLAADILWEKDPETGADVETRFETENDEMKDLLLSRTDWEGTWPSRPLWFDVENDTTIDPLWSAEYRYLNDGKYWTAADTSVTPKYLKKGKARLVKSDEWLENLILPLGENASFTTNPYIDPAYDAQQPYYTTVAPTWATTAYTKDNPAPIQLSELAGTSTTGTATITSSNPALNGKTEAAAWNAFVSQLTWDQAVLQINGMFQTIGHQALGVPFTGHSDGPQGITRPWVGGGDNMISLNTYGGVGFCPETLVACTWNIELAEKQGNNVGEYGLWVKTNGWYAPSANMHRTPFSGRNFEYYSEDGVLAGNMLRAVATAASKKGLVCYMKHFVMNDQEAYRENNCTSSWADEQTMRQIYFKPFEWAIKSINNITTTSGATAPAALMSSFNRIGFTWAGGKYELLTEVVRGEWGFVGAIITDAHQDGHGAMSSDLMVRAGGDISLDGKTSDTSCIAKLTNSTESKTPTHMQAVHNAIKNQFYVALNCSAMLNGYAPGELDGSSSKIATGYAAGGSAAGSAVSLGVYKQGDTIAKVSVADAKLTGRSYGIYAGALPKGLTFAANGEITGTIAADATPGAYTFSTAVRLDTDAGGQWTVVKGVRYFKFTVREPIEFTGEKTVVTSANAHFSADVTSAFTADQSQQVVYSLSTEEGFKAPDGVFVSASGRLYGSIAAAGEYKVKVIAASNGKTSETEVAIYVGALSYSAQTLATGKVGVSYFASISATIANVPVQHQSKITYSLRNTSQVLPEGLSLSEDGYITGTPTKAVEGQRFQVTANAGIYGSSYVYITITVEAAEDTQGNDGKSAYEIAVENGFEGTEEEWLESLNGDKGDKGDKGDTGAAGKDGAAAEGGCGATIGTTSAIVATSIIVLACAVVLFTRRKEDKQ